jgi:hypothetical protein
VPINIRSFEDTVLCAYKIKDEVKSQYPPFFHNLETLREAICDVWQVGDIRQKLRIVLAIEAAGF